MLWFVIAVVLGMLYLIDLTTNVHLLVTRRLARRRAARVAQTQDEFVPWHDVDRATLLRELHDTRAA